MAEKRKKKADSPLKREAKTFAKTAATFGILGSGDTGQRIKNILSAVQGRKASRHVETFSDAVARHGLAENEIQARTAEVKATADLIALVAVLALVMLLASVYVGWPFSVVSLLCLGSVWSICQTLVWRFRYDQLRDRELFAFKDWLLGRRTGEFK
ncbi:hypothetical protein [Cupriavidus alkaliphilus]|uniref:hypothetical protein n=1 Tax=Cupriavidus alkaliphilus TaxID=942866 RepID=UPI00339D9E1F